MKYINGNPKRPYVTPELMDRLLNYLIEQFQVETYIYADTEAVRSYMHDIDLDLLDGMFVQLSDDTLIDSYALNRNSLNFIIKLRAVMFAGKGGYVARDELLNQQMKLLTAQLNELQKEVPGKNLTKVLESASHLAQLLKLAFGG